MNNKRTIGVIIILLVIIIVAVGVKTTPINSSNSQPTNKNGASLASLSTHKAPWAPEYSHLSNRLAAINMPLLSAEGTAQHIHAHLDIYIYGKHVQVPSQIGIPPQGGITPLHTHDNSGIIHIESPNAKAIYNLGQFFDIWGVKLTNTSIGSYVDQGNIKLRAFSNGQRVGNISTLPLTKHEEIVLLYGGPNQPPRIPYSYNFPQGL